MKKQLKHLCIVCCVCLPFLTFSQMDTLLKRKNVDYRKIANSTKLELVYKSGMVTEYSTQAPSRSFFVEYPYIRINDAKPVYVDKQAEILQQYYSKCYPAQEQLDLMNKQRRTGKLQYTLGVAAGIVTGLSGVFAATGEHASRKFATRMAAGGALIFTGAYLGLSHFRKAQDHLRLSVDLYNANCYKPAVDETGARKEVASTSGRQIPSEKKYYQDTVLYELIRNEPTRSNLFGVLITPVLVDVNGLNLNISGNLGAFYTYQSKIGISGTFRRAYLDNLTGSEAKPPAGTVGNYGIAVNYQKLTNIEIQTKISLLSREKEGKYSITLGTAKLGPTRAIAEGRVEGSSVRALTLRLGFQADNRVIQNDTRGIDYVNATPSYRYVYRNQTYELMPFYLINSSAMMQSNILSVGIASSSFGDIKIKMHDENYKGRREQRYQTDLYADILYAYNICLQDITYFHELYTYTQEYGQLAQQLDVSQTPLSKLGARIGYQALGMFGSSPIGSKIAFELGVRPGPKGDKFPGDNFYLHMVLGFVLGGRLGK